MKVSSHAIRKASSPRAALTLYRLMQWQGVPTNSYAALFALKAGAGLSSPAFVRHMHAQLLKSGLVFHVYVATALLNVYVRSSKCIGDARRMFDEMPERNEVTWNTMITGCFMWGDVGEAWAMFESMPVRNLETWSAMITGHVGACSAGKGLALFRQMMAAGEFRPDEVMLVALVSCCNKGTYGLLGKSIHAYAQKNSWSLNVILASSLIDMYAKCGYLRSAKRVFNRMKDRNVTTWSALINGMALHGCGAEALSLFDQMKEAEVEPNELTFTGVLNACRHSGLVMEGLKNFHSMVKEYGLEPRIQHYGCMVDLLGKAGYLAEAHNLIETMRMEPNMTVWSSFLASCKMHQRFDVAERVIERVLRLANPERDGGVYTLISDLYAFSGKWDDAERVRKLMLQQNVRKATGLSLVKMHQVSQTESSC